MHSSPPEGLVSSIGRLIILVIYGQVPTLVYLLNKLVLSFDQIYFLFWCVLTLPFVKTVELEV